MQISAIQARYIMKYFNWYPRLLKRVETKIFYANIAVRILLPLSVILCSLYLFFAWDRHQRAAEAEAIQLVQVAGIFFQSNYAEAISDGPERKKIADSLELLVTTIKHVQYAYILSQNNEILILADATGAYPPDAQLVSQKCEESIKSNHHFLDAGKCIFAISSTACGTYIDALTPVYDKNGSVLAGLGFRYLSSEWYKALWIDLLPDIAVALFFVLLVGVWSNFLCRYAVLHGLSNHLMFQKNLYRKIFEQAPIGIALADCDKGAISPGFNSINPAGEVILGRSGTELLHINWTQLTHPKDLEVEFPQFQRFTEGKIDAYSCEKRLFKPDGTCVWVNVKLVKLVTNPVHDTMYLCLFEDISGRKKAEGFLRESERSKAAFLSHLPGMAYRCQYDEDWTMEYVSDGCEALTGYTSHDLIGTHKISYAGLIAPQFRMPILKNLARPLAEKNKFHMEYEIITKEGEHKWVLDMGQGVYDDFGNIEAIEGIVLDVTVQKKQKGQIVFLKEHDQLTGIYSRNRLQSEIKKLDHPSNWPLSVIVCDINGLRVINDAYGNEQGDKLIIKVAYLLQKCCKPGQVLGRVGGDEFMILLPCTDAQGAHKLSEDIHSEVERYNHGKKQSHYAISLSVGYSTKHSGYQKIDNVVKYAEKYLKNTKLLNRQSYHSAIVSSIMAALYAKSQETEEHGQRLGQYARLIGENLGLGLADLDDLQLLSKLHDIGKIGIDDRILNKPGKLTDEEWKMMKQHPEIGYRIALSTPQLEHIAKYILHHHERWDGAGYPRGLKGDTIPLLSRILAIVDAYDAMTEDRVYRQAMSHQCALEEIKRQAGTQFDPQLSDLFIKLLNQNKVIIQ